MKRKQFFKLSAVAALLSMLPTITLLASDGGSNPSAKTTPNSYIDVNGTKFAYRKFGKKSAIPLVCANFMTGNMDNWDPAVIDALASEREVIIFDNKGVAASGGEIPNTIDAMAKDAEAFIDALGLKKIDLLGFSIGGMISQKITIDRPELIHKLILVGTGPRGGVKMDSYPNEVYDIFKKTYPQPDEILLKTFFTPSEKSQKAGWAYLNRIRARVGKEPALTDKVMPAQLAAIFTWGKPYAGSYDYLKDYKQPTLIIHGDQDIIMPPINALILKQNIPNAVLSIYPDANHAPLYQLTGLFIKQVNEFLK